MLYKKTNNKAMFLLMCVFFILIEIPYIIRYEFIYFFVFGVMLLIISFLFYHKYIFRTKAIVFPLLFFISALIYRFFGVSSASLGNYGVELLCFCTIINIIISFELFDKKQREKMYFVVIVTIMVSMIFGFYYNIKFENFNIDTFGDVYGKINAGNVGFNYGVMFLSLASYCVGKRYQFIYRIVKVFNTLFFILSIAYLLICSNSATIIISYAVALLLIFMANIPQKRIDFKVIIFCFCLLAIAIFAFSYDAFLNIVYKVLGNKIAERFSTIGNFFSGNLSDSDVSNLSRLQFLELDLKNWVSTPITFLFGNGYHLSEADDAVTFAIINKSGGHSLLIDVLPRYGIIGFIMFFLSSYYGYLFIKSNSKREYKTVLGIMFVVFLFNGVFNSFLHPCLILGLMFILLLNDDKEVTYGNEKQLQRII